MGIVSSSCNLDPKGGSRGTVNTAEQWVEVRLQSQIRAAELPKPRRSWLAAYRSPRTFIEPMTAEAFFTSSCQGHPAHVVKRANRSGYSRSTLQHPDLAAAPVARSRSRRHSSGHELVIPIIEPTAPARILLRRHEAAARRAGSRPCVQWLRDSTAVRRPTPQLTKSLASLAICASNAGSPLTVVLRQVDEVELNIEQNVDILPGKHRLLVDCRIAETQNVQPARRRYRSFRGATTWAPSPRRVQDCSSALKVTSDGS